MESLFSARWYRVAGLHPRLRPHVRVSRHIYRGKVWYLLQDTRFRPPSPRGRDCFPFHRADGRPARGGRDLAFAAELTRGKVAHPGRYDRDPVPAQRYRPAPVRDHAGCGGVVPPQPRTREEAACRHAEPAVFPRALVRPRRLARPACSARTVSVPPGGGRGVGSGDPREPADGPVQLGRGPLVRRRAHAHAALFVFVVAVLSPDQGAARARPRPRGQGLGRRSARDGGEPADAHSGAVRRCLRGIGLSREAPPRNRRWRRHHGGTVPRRAGPVRVAARGGRHSARHRLHHHADRRHVHRSVQRQPVAAFRRLLRAVGPARHTQSRLPLQRLHRLSRPAPAAGRAVGQSLP